MSKKEKNQILYISVRNVAFVLRCASVYQESVLIFAHSMGAAVEVINIGIDNRDIFKKATRNQTELYKSILLAGWMDESWMDR